MLGGAAADLPPIRAMTQFRDTRHLQFVYKPGAPAPDGTAAADRVRLAKMFALALDGLVRALLLGSSAVEGLLVRATDAARAMADQTLQVEANGVTLDGEVVLAATPDSGRWILPTWYAGLRAFTPLGDVRGEDLRVLATGFARAAPGAEAIDQLASWLWSGPVDGIRLDLRTCAVERIEAVTGDVNTGRTALRLAWLDAAARALQDVDPRAVRPQPVLARERAWWQRATAGDLFLGPEASEALRAEADNRASRLRLEMMTAMAEGAWADAVPPPLVARQLTRLAAVTFDRDLNSLTGLLSADEADYGRICVAELAHFPVGEALARAAPLRADLSQDELNAIQALINRQSEPVGSGFLRGLLSRLAENPDELMAAFAQILRMLGFEAFMRLASPTTLAPAVRPLVGRLVLYAAPTPDELVQVCATLPVTAFAEILRATPPDVLQPLLPALAGAMQRADPRERTQIVLWLTDPGRIAQVTPDAFSVLAEALVQSGGAGWELRAVRLVADTALRTGHAGEALLNLMRSARAPADVRVTVLEALARSPGHAAEALKWRMGEMFDAPELRDRLVELRKQRDG